MQETNANGTKDYAYDHRGNLLSVTSGKEVLRAYGFDAANQMNSSMGMTDGQIKKAVYQYNGLGHRMEQSIAAGDAAPEQTIRYTLDLTRQYHNLLQKTENNVEKTYFWDGNVTGMEEEGREHFYFQDDLGSPMQLADEAGRSEETYGFDEFGNDIRTAKDIFKDSLQNFGFTGYQMDSAGGLYFAQARRYDAGVGRFVSEDFIKGHIAVPYTMNHYNYCWNRPMDLVDLNGMWPTAGVTSDLFGIHEKAAEMDDSDPVHSVSDWCSKGDNLKSAGELGKYSIDWWVQYATNKNLKNTLKTSQTAEEMAALEGISLGRYRRTTRARITDGISEMESIGGKAKSASKFGKGDLLFIGIDVGVGIYDNYQSGASTTEFVSDAAVDIVMSTTETLATTALASLASATLTGFLGGSAVPGLGNVIGAIAGFGIGLLIVGLDEADFDGNGKSVRDDIKDMVYGWISGGSDEKE